MSKPPRTGTDPAAKDPGQYEVYDFRRPTTLVREHSRRLELAFETFSRQWATKLTAKVRVLSTVTLDHVMMQTYDDYVATLPPTTAMVLCEIQGSTPRAVIQVPNNAALSWVSYMLGGTSEVTAPDRKFTAIEQKLVSSLMDDALEDLHYSLGSLLAVPIKVQSIQHNSQFAQAAQTSDLMIVARFDMRMGELDTGATIAIPADVILPQLGEANPTEASTNAADRMRAQIASVPVEAAVQLQTAGVTPRQVLDLSVGDLIPLPHAQSRPLDVTVAGRTIATAAVVPKGSRIAALIVTTEESSR